MTLFALTIFAGAFLLFQVQPLIAKFILPWFGGGAAVWTICMLFFQVFLLAGYTYAHITSRYLAPRKQAALHTILLLVALAFLPIVPGTQWKPGPADDPTWHILLLLTASLGLPYFVLSATGPLLQAWFSRLHPGVSPYRLYALSNVGSLLALVSYPFAVEPMFTRQTQAVIWALGFGSFALLCGACAWLVWNQNAKKEGRKTVNRKGARQENERKRKLQLSIETPGEPENESTGATSAYVKLLWFLLPACGSVLLLATTNKLCQDVAAIPFLWVLPLSLYLITFILSFDQPRWYARRTFTLLLVPMLGLVCYALFQECSLSLLSQVAIYCGASFVCCMVCHGEVYRLRPSPRFLTSFYLSIAAGGAAGGAFVAVVAPLVFRSYAELHTGVGLLAALVTVVHWRERSGWSISGKFIPAWTLAAAGSAALVFALFLQVRQNSKDTLFISRNFYGMLRVSPIEPDDPVYHAKKLTNGHIHHGLQFVDAAKSRMPTSYYHELSGVGLALEYLPVQTNRRVGVIGLGVGTLAAYARAGDTFRFYDINPQVRQVAESQFTYLQQAEGHVEVVMGDARLALENESPQQFDLLVLDAFSSDAIPAHLLTREAFEVYLRHLKPGGVIAVHITNRHLNLLPVTMGLAAHFGFGAREVAWVDTPALWWNSSSRWALLSRNLEFLNNKRIMSASQPPNPKTLLWTDDYTSLIPIMKWR